MAGGSRNNNDIYTATKEITLSANNTTASENIFQITGSIEVIEICGRITDATTLVNLTAGYLELYDGTNHPEITANGITLSGLAVDTAFFKNELNTSALALANNAACVVTEPTAAGRAFQGFQATQKTATATYIRFTYTTTDTPINAKIEWHIHYKTKDGGTLTPV